MSTKHHKTALVTGAAKRLGRAMALSFAKDGMNVVIHYRTSRQEALLLEDELRGFGVGAWALAGDLACADEVKTLIARAVDRAGPLDVLVNNASVYRESRLAEVTRDALESDLCTNGFSPLLLSRHFAQNVKTGVVLNLLDCRMVDYDHRHAAYHLSKQMLYQITRLLALELAPGIRVNGVAPGVISPSPGDDDSYREKRRNTNPLEQVGSVRDVVEAARLLISSDFVTGQVIFVDGGRHLKGSVY